MHAVRTDKFEKALDENLKALETRAIETDVPNVASPILYCIGDSHGAHIYASPNNVLPGGGGLLLRLPDEVGPDIFVDPGWGSFTSAMRLSIPLDKIGLILISHCHIDHVGDLHALLLFLKFRKIKPVLIANKTCVHGSIGQPSILPEYYRNLCKRVIVPDNENTVKIGNVRISAFRTRHRENPNVVGESLGFVVSVEEIGHYIAFITDGPLDSLSETVLENLRKCQTLVVNLGTMSALPESNSHNKVFDNALCISGLDDLLKNLSSEQNNIRTILTTHVGAELFATECNKMKEILQKEGCGTPLELLELAARAVVDQTLGADVDLHILKEGDTKTV